VICEAAVAVACATARVERRLRQRLDAKHLSYRWVVCVREHAVFRCNVDFGDPHIVRYCAVVRRGRLVTDREDPRIHCGRGPEQAAT
jgi:hypothetical protein